VKLGPRATANFANTVARALGLSDANGTPLSFDEPRSPRTVDALYTRLGTALDSKRPSKHAPSIGELVTVLVWSKGAKAADRRWPAPPSRSARPRDATKALAELVEVVALGSFERTKRAERGRVLAELLLLFELEGLLDVEVGPSDDPEEALRRVRKALAAR
jgi:hypothetical protein